MLEKLFPLNLEGIVIGGAVGDFLPAGEEVDGLLNVWVPGGAWGGAYALYPAPCVNAKLK